MNVDFGEQKTVSQVLLKPNPGCYAVESGSISWVSCREQFANKWNEKTEGFYFSHDPDKGNDIASFITKTEEIIEETPSSFAKTNRNFILWIKPTPFWSDCMMRRSLFTILLRSGLKFDVENNNYEDALYSHAYASQTKIAVKRFLFGFTDFIRDDIALGPEHEFRTGWLSTFSHKTEDQIKKQLLNPKESEYCAVGQSSLWG